MANKKAEILTMDGQVVSPITLATNVLLDDGRTAQDLLDSRDESMFSPTITTSSSISKVGQGDNVDFSENVIDGAYKSCVLKGKTLVNYNAEGNDRNEYVCIPSVEGESVTVNGTVEGKVKSAILSGQTLVNLANLFSFDDDVTTSSYFIDKTVCETSKLQVNKPYLICFKPTVKENLNTGNYVQLQLGLGNSKNITLAHPTVEGNSYTYNINHNEWNFIKVTFKDFLGYQYLTVRPLRTSSPSNDKPITYNVNEGFMLLEYQQDMENWDIPYFKGMQSVKMPVLTTSTTLINYDVQFTDTGKDLISDFIKIPENIKGKILYPSFNTNKINENTSKQFGMETYDSNKQLLSRKGYWLNNCYNGLSPIILNEEVNYVKFEAWSCYELLGSNGKIGLTEMKNINYIPYKSNILTVNEEVTLRGIGDVKDTLDLVTGELTQRIGYDVADGVTLKAIRQYPREDDFEEFHIGFPELKGDVKTISTFSASYLKRQRPSNAESFWANDANGALGIIIRKDKLSEISINGLNEYLKLNPIKFSYELAEPTIKTVVLSDNHVYSYKDVTHYTCSSEEGSLLPTLAIEEGVKYKAIIKPSTKYSIVFNRTEVASGLTVDLGGATANTTSTTLGKNIVQITTPPTLSHNYVIFKGLGNVIKDVQVIEGDVVGDEPYFEGICDCKSPILLNCGKNLFDANEFKRVFGSNVEIGLDGTIISLGDIKGGNHNLGFYSPINIALKPNTKYTLCLFNLNTSGQIIRVEGCLSTCNSELSMSNVAINSVGYKVFTTNSQNYKDGVSFKVMTGATTGEKAQYQIMIVEGEVSHETYSQYKSNTTTFNQKDDKTIVLRSLPNGVCDTLDLETGEYVQRIGEREYQVGDESNSQVLTDKVNTQYELATPITTTIDLKQHPFAYKDGYVVLTSSSEEISLTPTIEYSLIANRLGQIQSNQKLVEKQQTQIDELESMVITNLVNTQYQQALNEIKLGVK